MLVGKRQFWNAIWLMLYHATKLLGCKLCRGEPYSFLFLWLNWMVDWQIIIIFSFLRIFIFFTYQVLLNIHHLKHLKQIFFSFQNSKFYFPSVLMGKHFNEIVSKTISSKCTVLFVAKQPLLTWCDSSGKWSVSKVYFMFDLHQTIQIQFDISANRKAIRITVIFKYFFAYHTKM